MRVAWQGALLPGLSRLFCALLAALVLLGAVAMPAAAHTKLSSEAAEAKASLYATKTCGHDPYCAKHGVTGCYSAGPRVALCHMYIQRDTPVQGPYRCQREVRIGLNPPGDRGIVKSWTGWTCRR
ncbi:MAG TPA: hypothetical protein VMH33_05320 [Solirubrobacterales bacterium]|nr:hypothetical protein [Solirubrobacterales bacterium]